MPPVSYRYDSQLNLIRTRCEGFVSLSDVTEHFRALLADRERVYGLARMFQAMTGKFFHEVEVFANDEVAEAWLHPSPR